jgi:hypothetical protein
MKKIQFTVEIKASEAQVFDLMLGLSDKSTYEQWTALFNPTSTYDGSWTKGSKMLFVGYDENGEKSGIVSEIAEHLANQFISIRHYGLVQADVEITSGPEVEKWANGFENYSFEEKNDGTQVTVEMDVTEEFLDYMNESYPKALAKLKELGERQAD